MVRMNTTWWQKNTHLLMPLTMYDNDDENFDQDNDEHDEND